MCIPTHKALIYLNKPKKICRPIILSSPELTVWTCEFNDWWNAVQVNQGLDVLPVSSKQVTAAMSQGRMMDLHQSQPVNGYAFWKLLSLSSI